MKGDWDTFNSRVQYNQDGSKSNLLKLNGVESTDVKALAAKLKQLDENVTTHGEHYPIGELYGFKLLVKTEKGSKMEDGIFREAKENRFFVEGEGNVKYSYNNGRIANDPKLAVNYFINALEKIPSLIEKYEKENRKLSADMPVLQEITKSVWRKENELQELKSELAAVDRKIQLSLKQVESPQTHFDSSTPLTDHSAQCTAEGGLVSGIGERLQGDGETQKSSLLKL
jgi:hypothetical protein